MSPKRLPDASVLLVVEDDDLVRIAAVEMLLDFGFDVVEARDADVAWGVLTSRDDIRAVFSDIDMPGSMCGLALAERIHASWPHIGIVLTSGRRRPDDRAVRSHEAFVQKPYTTSQLIEAIRVAV